MTSQGTVSGFQIPFIHQMREQAVAFSGTGAGAFSCSEWAQATQINSVSCSFETFSGRSRLSLTEGRWGQGGTFQL